MLQSDLIQRLVSLNTAAGARVFHQEVPQGIALPFIATGRISGSQPTTINGEALFSRATIRVAIFASLYAEGEPIERAICDAFRGFRGFLGTTRVEATRVENASDEVSFVDGDRVIKGIPLDLFFLYQE